MADHAAAPQPVPAPIFRATLGQATGEGAAQEVAQPGAPQAGLGGALGDAPTPLGRPEGSGMAAGGLGGGGMAGGLTGAPSDEVARTRLVVHTDRPEAAAATLMKLAAERGWVLHPAPDDPREGSPQVARVMLTVPADQVHVFTRELARAAPGVAGAHLPPSLAAPGATGAVPSHRGAGTPSAQPGAGEKALSDETHRERAAEDYTVRAIDRNTQMGQAPGGGQRLDRPVGEPSQRQVDAARTAALRVYVVEFRAATPPAGAGRRPTSQQRARPAR
ncbi:MAG TPA: hypothetical protein VLH79_01825 [Chthonomonadales bacterium]|nr:hypothetical protein [Chthonomonadales bacterium]